MPTEFRHIIFSRDELLSAIQDYRIRRRDPLPTGPVAHFSIVKDPALHAQLQIEVEEGERSTELTIDRDELANALIMYCIDQQIPMPVQSNKFLQLFGGSVGLVITRNVASAEIGPVVQ